MTNINPLTHKNHINHKTTIKKKKVKEEVQDKVIMSEGSLNLKEVNLKSLQTYSKEAIEVENKPAPFTQTENTSFKTDSPKEWNIVIYMAGDNTLEESMAKNMVDLERYGSSKSINILVQFDRGSRQHRGISPWDGARRFYVTKSDNPDDIISPVKMDLGDINTANPDELKEFIIWAHKEYPAKHTLLIVSNHGGGFAGVANDDSEKSVMSLPDLARALDEAKKALGKDKFDIVGFDCCLMGQTEVAYEIKDHAGIMIGSEEAEGNGGWPYSSIFGENGKLLKSIDSMVRRQVNITPEMVAKKIINESTKIQDQLPTLSAIDLSKMDTIAKAASDFAGEVIKNTKELTSNNGNIDDIRKIASQSESYSKTIPFIEPYGQYRDVIDFAEKVIKSPDIQSPGLKEKAVALLKATQTAIIAEQHSEFYKDSNGLSVYIPTDKPKPQKYGYTKTEWAKDTLWDEMMIEGQIMTGKKEKWIFVPPPLFDKEIVKQKPDTKPPDLMDLITPKETRNA